MSAPVIDVVVDSPRWAAAPEAEAVIRRAVANAAAASPSDGELAIVLTDNSAIRALNRQWRGRDEATNVLSFPALKLGANAAPATPRPLGDVVIAFETVAREAEAENRPFAHHLAHLAVHGYLHLVGYDHMDDDDAEAMERLERTILATLDVPDPYATRDAAVGI